MPVYDALCSGCGIAEEYLSSVDDRLNTPPCRRCGEATTIAILKPPMSFMSGRFEAFKSTVDGSIIHNQRELREHNKRNGVVSMADGYSEEQLQALAVPKPMTTPVTTKEELVADIMAATMEVKNGYKPEVQHED